MHDGEPKNNPHLKKKKRFPVTHSVYTRCCGNSCQLWPLQCVSLTAWWGRSLNPGTDYMCVCVKKFLSSNCQYGSRSTKEPFFPPAFLASPSSNISFHQSFTLSIQWAPSLLLFSLSTPLPPPHTHSITSILLKTLRPFFLNNIFHYMLF